jgi:hypothetical protein
MQLETLGVVPDGIATARVQGADAVPAPFGLRQRRAPAGAQPQLRCGRRVTSSFGPIQADRFPRDTADLIGSSAASACATGICAGRPFGTYDNIGRACAQGLGGRRARRGRSRPGALRPNTRARRRGPRGLGEARQRPCAPPEACADRDARLGASDAAFAGRGLAGRLGQLRRCRQFASAATTCCTLRAAWDASEPRHAVRPGREPVGRNLPDRRRLRDAGPRGVRRREGAVVEHSRGSPAYCLRWVPARAPAGRQVAEHPTNRLAQPLHRRDSSPRSRTRRSCWRSRTSAGPARDSMPLAAARRFPCATGGTVEEVLALDP